MWRSKILPMAVLAGLALCASFALLTAGPPAATSQGVDPFETVYGGCPTDPDLVCRYYHGPNAVATGMCGYGACFEMSYAGNIRVVAADGEGPFPKTWFIWTTRELVSPAGLIACDMAKFGSKKTRARIPAEDTRCAVETANDGGYAYYEHFASNPASGCLAWLECRVPIL